MMRRKLPLLSMVFLLGFSMSSHIAAAAIYYVDNSGSPACGNSPTNGSASNPWCTITYGVGHIAGGDTLYVKAGMYKENVYINGPAGTASAPTLISTYPGHLVTIAGAGVNTGRVKIANTSYIAFDGFTITNFNQGLFVENSQRITVQNVTVHHVGQEGIHVISNSSYVTIQNSKVHDTRQWQYNGEGIYVGQGSTGPLDNSNNVTIRNNTVYNVNDEGIELKPGTHDCVVEGNNVYQALLDPLYSGSGAGAIEVNESNNGNQVWNSNPNHVVRNNRVHDTKMGIRAGTGARVYNNVIYNIIGTFPGVYVTNSNGDSYMRKIYHNTVDLPSSRAIVVSSGTADVMNNIGPATTNNIATSDAYYVGKAVEDYHLASGTAPINAGRDLANIVPTDIEGKSRVTNPPPDFGAYEYYDVSSGPPANPTGLSVVY
jgi:parallel beta-helix repeat protein